MRPTNRARLTRASGAAIVLGLLFAALPAQGVVAGEDVWAWAVVRTPKHSYKVKDARDHANSGRDVIFKRFRQGVSQVTFRGIDARLEEISDQSGVILLTPLTSSSAICVPQSWASKPMRVGVRCYDKKGQFIDVGFILNFLAIRSTTPTMGNVWSNLAGGTYTPRVAGNSAAQPTHIDRISKGRSSTTWSGIGTRYGNGQATALIRQNVCVADLWLPASGDERIDVSCRSRGGALRHAAYSASFTAGIGLKGDGGSAWAYLVADKPGANSYTPTLDLQASSPAITARVKRLGKGRYVAKLPGMPRGGAAQVTPILGPGRRCNVSSIRKKSGTQRIGVRCFNAKGTKSKDASFSLSYTR